MPNLRYFINKKPLKPLKEGFWNHFEKTSKSAEVAGKLLFHEPSSDTTTQNLQFAMSMLMSNMPAGISIGNIYFIEKNIFRFISNLKVNMVHLLTSISNQTSTIIIA